MNSIIEMKHIYTFLCLFLFCGVTNADQWLCIADKSVGFYYDENTKSWIDTPFSVKKSKYIFRRQTEDDNPIGCLMVIGDMTGRWGLFEFGELCSFISCGLGQEFVSYGRIVCDNAQETIHFSRETLRFTLSRASSYYESGIGGRKTDSEAGTPHIEIGRCSKF